MAEGFAKVLEEGDIDAYSAGIESHGLNTDAVRVMMEVGVDISGHESKLIGDLPGAIEFDYVITVCGHADESCPVFPAKTSVIHRGFDDPPKLAANSETDEERLSHFRRVRDEIKAYVMTLPMILK